MIAYDDDDDYVDYADDEDFDFEAMDEDEEEDEFWGNFSGDDWGEF